MTVDGARAFRAQRVALISPSQIRIATAVFPSPEMNGKQGTSGKEIDGRSGHLPVFTQGKSVAFYQRFFKHQVLISNLVRVPGKRFESDGPRLRLVQLGARDLAGNRSWCSHAGFNIQDIPGPGSVGCWIVDSEILLPCQMAVASEQGPQGYGRQGDRAEAEHGNLLSKQPIDSRIHAFSSF